MKQTFVYNLNTIAVKEGDAYYVKSRNSVTMRDTLIQLGEKTKMHYATRMAKDRKKPIKNVVLYELNHTYYDYFVLVIDDISALQKNVKNAFTAIRTANNRGIKAYVYDNSTGIRTFVPPYKNADALVDFLKEMYVEFQEKKADEVCRIRYEQLSKDCKELLQALEAVVGKVEIPRNYREYVTRNANAYDITLPKTHYQTVDNVYQREGTERGARNTIGHCVNVYFNQIVDREPDYVLNEQYLMAYLTIRYYQAIGFKPNPELYALCPECAKHGRIEYIKRTHTGEPGYCKVCGTEVETYEFLENAERLF